MGAFATRLSDIESRSAWSGSPSINNPHQPPINLPYGLPGYDDISPITSAANFPTAAATPSATAATTHYAPNLPITQISFPPSPSPFSTFDAPDTRHEPAMEPPAVPSFHKLSFPMFDGKDDPLGWLSKCEQFFRAQRTLETDKVWLASFHLTGVAQQWNFELKHSGAGSPPLRGPSLRHSVTSASGECLAPIICQLWRARHSTVLWQHTLTPFRRAWLTSVTYFQHSRWSSSPAIYQNPSAQTSSCNCRRNCSGPCSWCAHTSVGRAHHHGLHVLRSLRPARHPCCHPRPRWWH